MGLTRYAKSVKNRTHGPGAGFRSGVGNEKQAAPPLMRGRDTQCRNFCESGSDPESKLADAELCAGRGHFDRVELKGRGAPQAFADAEGDAEGNRG